MLCQNWCRSSPIASSLAAYKNCSCACAYLCLKSVILRPRRHLRKGQLGGIIERWVVRYTTSKGGVEINNRLTDLLTNSWSDFSRIQDVLLFLYTSHSFSNILLRITNCVAWRWDTAWGWDTSWRWAMRHGLKLRHGMKTRHVLNEPQASKAALPTTSTMRWPTEDDT